MFRDYIYELQRDIRKIGINIAAKEIGTTYKCIARFL